MLLFTFVRRMTAHHFLTVARWILALKVDPPMPSYQVHERLARASLLWRLSLPSKFESTRSVFAVPNMLTLLDPRYGGEDILYHVKSQLHKDCRVRNRLCLHAACLSIPDLGLHVQTPIPGWWYRLSLDRLINNYSTDTTCLEKRTAEGSTSLLDKIGSHHQSQLSDLYNFHSHESLPAV
jgi:hypothetical protein